MRRLASCLVAVLLFVGTAPGAAAQAIPAQLAAQIQAIDADKATWSPAERKMASSLTYAVRAANGIPLGPGVPPPRRTIVPDALGYIEVAVHGTISSAVTSKVAEIGGVIVESIPDASYLRASVPLVYVEQLAALPDVKRVGPPPIAFNFKLNTSAGDVAHRTDVARSLLGVDGTGVKVGVLSDGVGALTTVQSTGDLPAVEVLPGQGGPTPNTSEGTAMLEIVHDLAPGAALAFATAVTSPEQMALNIRALRDAGANVIVDDVLWFGGVGDGGEPVFQDGPIAQAVEEVAGTGVLYFSAAGNFGNKNDGTSHVWEGDFLDSGTVIEGRAVHSFGGGVTANAILTDSSFFMLQWADPVGMAANDYDLYLVSPDMLTIFDRAIDVQDGIGGDDYPSEVIDSRSFNDAGNKLIILKRSGQGRFLHLNGLEGALGTTTAGQTFGHSAAESAISVAAVPVSQGPVFDGGETVENFSSDGPRRVFFEADGTPITPGNFSSTGGLVRQKPDLAAADGVSTATPDPNPNQPGNPFNPFFGTSAAAPHAAAIGALLMDAVALSAEHAEFALFNATIDIEAPGVDRDAGHGISSGFDAVDLTAAPLAGTPILTSFSSAFFAMSPSGGPLHRLKPNNGPSLISLPATIHALAIRGTAMYSASWIASSTTQIWRTDLTLNTATRLDNNSPDPDLNQVWDFAFVGNSLYAIAANPDSWPPQCADLQGRVVQINTTSGEGTVISSGGNICGPCDIVSSGGQLYITEPVWPSADFNTPGPGAIIKVDPATGAQSVFSQAGGPIVFPAYFARLSSGDFALIGATDATLTQWRLVRVNGTTGAQTLVGSLGASPQEIAAESAGTVLIAYNQGPVERVDMTTGQRTVLNSNVSNVRDIEVMPQGSGGTACGLGGELAILGVGLHRWMRRRNRNSRPRSEQ